MDEFIHFDRYGKIVVATIQGASRLDASNAELFHATLEEFSKTHPGAHVLLNFHHVEYISSAVISVILRFNKALGAKKGSLRICALNEYVGKVFEVTGLTPVFRPMENVQKAAETFDADLS